MVQKSGSITLIDITDVSISSTGVRYKQGDSGNTPPSDNWENWAEDFSSITLIEGKYLWTWTKILYSDGTETNSYSVSRNPSSSIVTVTNSSTVWQESDDGVNIPQGNWNVQPPAATKAYMWSKTIVTYSNNEQSVAYNVAKNGVDGTAPIVSTFIEDDRSGVIITDSDGNTAKIYNGEDGEEGKPGKDGNSSYIHIAWADSVDTSQSPIQVTGFSKSGAEGKQFIGTYTDEVKTDSDDATKYYWAKFKGDKGDKGASVSVSKVGNTVTIIDGDGNVVTVEDGEDGQSIKGDAGEDAYLHIAWATSADGSIGFSTTDATNKTYIGTYTDHTAADSTDRTKYKWVKIKGEDGLSIESVVNYYLASSKSTEVTTVESGWTTTIQNTDSDKPYLWNYEEVKNSKNVVISTTTPIIIGNYAEDGAPGRGIDTIIEYYKATNDNVNAPTSWSNQVETTSETARYLWNYERITYTDGSAPTTTSPRIIGTHGETGASGYNQATIYLYKRETTSPNKPNGSATYTFASGNLTETNLNGWTRQIPTNNDQPCWVIYAVAIGKSATVTIATSDWVGPTQLVANGADGDTGRGIISIEYQYLLSTLNGSGAKPSATDANWSTSIPAYSNGKYYWTKVTITYDSAPTTVTNIYIDNALTDANRNATKAVADAAEAIDKASDAVNKAGKAQDDLAAYKSANDTRAEAIESRARYFWWDSEGAHIASGVSSTMGNSNTNDPEPNKPATYGFNALTAPGALKLRRYATDLAVLDTASLKFYIPPTNWTTTSTTGPKAMELTTQGLYFYKPSTSSNTKMMELTGNALKFFDATGTTAQAEFGGTQARISGTINAFDGQIGNSSDNYWYIGNYTDYFQNSSAAIKSHGTAFIQLGNNSTWRLATNRIHTAWNDDSSSGEAFRLHFPQYSDKYWDSGLHLPTSTTDKFLYIRNAPKTQSLENLGVDLEDGGYNYWTYRFYVSADGSLYARNLYILSDDGTTTAIGGADEAYLLKAGGTITGNLTVNGTLTASLSGNATTATTADKVANNLVIQLNSGATEGTNKFTYNGSAKKEINITKSSIGLGNVENKSGATIRSEITSANITSALGFTPYSAANPDGYITSSDISGKIDAAGTGLSKSGTTLNHSNSVTAQATQAVYPIKIDAQGHISAYGAAIVPLTASSSLSWSKITGAPTTLSGYGITDAKIANGVITLGSNTITPLTSQWTANLISGASATAKSNAVATNGNVYLNLVENNTVRNTHNLVGGNGLTIVSDANGKITFTSPDAFTGVSFKDGKITFTKAGGGTADIQTTDFVITQASGATGLVDANGKGISVGGAATAPVYFKDGTPVIVTSIPYTLLSGAPTVPTIALNGTATTAASFYAPTGAGTNNYVLKSNGSGAPSWTAQSNLSVGSATHLAHLTLNNTTLHNTSGTFAFSGSGDPWSGTDWVGLQVGDSVDKFQISANGNTLVFRQNDSGGTNTSWSDWVTMLTSGNYTSYTVTKTGSGASGTWGISISGSAASVSGTVGTANGGTGNTSFTANKLTYAETASKLSSAGGLSYFTGNSTASSAATYTRLHINGSTYGNTAANMISGTAGLFSWGDGGPQITFDTSATPGSGQAGALIFTDHDSAAAGASWHFVSNQTDWNVTSKRFHARTGISVGTNLPNTSYNLYVNGTTYLNGSTTVNGNTLKITNNSNTVTIGSQNSSFTYIYNSASIPFILNNSLLTTNGNLGDNTYPFGNVNITGGYNMLVSGAQKANMHYDASLDAIVFSFA